MAVIFLIVLFILAGILGWIGWELRAIRKILQARWGKGPELKEIVNHSIPCFQLEAEARMRRWKEACENDFYGKQLKKRQTNLTQSNAPNAADQSVSQTDDADSGDFAQEQ